MRQLICPEECASILSQYPEFADFDPYDWMSKAENYALVEDDNAGFAEYKSPGVFWVHFCFNKARGRKAISLTKDMLRDLFAAREARICVGLISMDNRKARWLIRQVGMKSLGQVETEIGICEMFYTRREDTL